MTTPAPPPGSPEETPSVWLALKLAWELGYMIALPAAGFGFAGAYVDKYLHTSPLFLILGLLIAFSLSAVGVYRKVREVIK